jgi:hypothetical protein
MLVDLRVPRLLLTDVGATSEVEVAIVPDFAIGAVRFTIIVDGEPETELLLTTGNVIEIVMKLVGAVARLRERVQ